MEELARELMHNGAIKRIKYFDNGLIGIQFPPFYLLVDSEFDLKNTIRYDLQYFLTYINNEYVAFHIKNIAIFNKGDIFAGPTHDFEEFTRDVNNYFLKPNNTINSKKIYLQKVNEKIYPTYRTEDSS